MDLNYVELQKYYLLENDEFGAGGWDSHPTNCRDISRNPLFFLYASYLRVHACQRIVETGSGYVTDIEGVKLFKKGK